MHAEVTNTVPKEDSGTLSKDSYNIRGHYRNPFSPTKQLMKYSQKPCIPAVNSGTVSLPEHLQAANVGLEQGQEAQFRATLSFESALREISQPARAKPCASWGEQILMQLGFFFF